MKLKNWKRKSETLKKFLAKVVLYQDNTHLKTFKSKAKNIKKRIINLIEYSYLRNKIKNEKRKQNKKPKC